MSTETTQTKNIENSTPLYKLHKVQRSFTKGGLTVDAVRGIDLEIEPGEIISLEGPSGSGKSTLLQLLGALDSPSGGSITFAGRELGNVTDRVLTQIRSQEIGFVFQHFNLIPTLTAEDNVAVAMAPQRIRHANAMERARELLTQVGLGHRLTHLPSRLSGGEQQRVAIARALANHPRVVIADEPTGNLDSESANEVIALLVGLRESAGVTIILATHDKDIGQIASRRIRLRDGKVLAA